MSVKSMREEKRNAVIANLMEYLKAAGEDVGFANSNEFNFPVVLEDGTEDFIVVKVSIPTGTRDGDPYDGYGARDDYNLKVADRAAKAEAAAAKKAAKIAKDEAARAAKAAAKAAHEAEQAQA